jgi:hypothetical protein
MPWRRTKSAARPQRDRPGHEARVTSARPWRPFSRLAERVAGALLFRAVPLQPRLVAAMRREAAELGGTPAEVIDLWADLRRQFRDCLSHGDPGEFLRWPPVERTMVKRSRRRVQPELAHLRARPDWRRRWRWAVRESTLGRPRPLPRWPWSSVNAIYQAYHACRFEETTGRGLASLRTIVEFGGGYGRLCHLVHDLGFTGTYVIFDLPEVGVLQRFYLRHVGLSVDDGSATTWPERGVVTVVDPNRFHRLLRARPRGEAAFIAIASLSEAPLALRDTVLAEVAAFETFLLLYSAQHDGLDNREYFARWRTALAEHDWSDLEVPHLEKPARYLFGHRPSSEKG